MVWGALFGIFWSQHQIISNKELGHPFKEGTAQFQLIRTGPSFSRGKSLGYDRVFKKAKTLPKILRVHSLKLFVANTSSLEIKAFVSKDLVTLEK